MSQPTQDLATQKNENQEEKISQWKLPGVNLNGLQKMGEQVSTQAVELAKSKVSDTQDFASATTELALRSSIDQTMNAFQIAVEQIHAKKIPAEKTALTSTINVGVIQLSIRVDIPMNSQEGDIEVEVES